MKKIFLIAVLSMITAMTYAQTFYEVKFTDPDSGEKFTGLFVYNDESDCVVRFTSKKMLKRNEVMDSRYICVNEDKESDDDTGVMAFVPEEEDFPIFLWIWEEDDASDMNEVPYITYDLENPDDAFEATSFEEISLCDMTEEYVSMFFDEDEPEYALMLGGIQTVKENGYDDDEEEEEAEEEDEPTVDPTPAVQPAATADPVFHLIMVANTKVSDIGTACARDLSNIKGEFSAISKVLGIKYDETIVSGDKYSKKDVINAVNALKPGANDIVMFVYSGHGFRFDNQKDYYPNMDLTASSYDDPTKEYAAMSDVYNTIVGKGARLNIVISDCCNTKLGVDTPMANANSLFSRANSNFDINKIRSLFLGTTGNVWATAASPGESSWCGVSGGFFILSFLENLRKQISPLEKADPTWEALINNSIVAAKKKSTSNASCKAQNGLQQVKTKAVKL